MAINAPHDAALSVPHPNSLVRALGLFGSGAVLTYVAVYAAHHPLLFEIAELERIILRSAAAIFAFVLMCAWVIAALAASACFICAGACVLQSFHGLRRRYTERRRRRMAREERARRLRRERDWRRARRVVA